MRNSKEKLFVKFIRAKAKTQYHKYKTDKCWVCGSDKNLELHHVFPLSHLVWGWLDKKGIKNPTNDPELREQLFKEIGHLLFDEENLLTLCKVHHTSIHNLFGKTYGEKMATKVKNYLTKQKEKFNG